MKHRIFRLKNYLRSFKCLTVAAALSVTGLVPARALEVQAFFYDDGTDTYIQSVRETFAAVAGKRGITYSAENASFDPMIQLSQIRGAVAGGGAPDVIVVNPAESEELPEIITMARKAGIPVIFYNRLHDLEPLKAYKNAWAVIGKPKEPGEMQAALVKAIEEAYPRMDRNKDGAIGCVLIEGEMHMPENDERTGPFLENVQNGRYPINVLHRESANWSRKEAATLMERILTEVPLDTIELIVANSDDMALGVISVLNKHGYNTGARHEEKYIPVTGFDATANGLEAVAGRKMVATIEQPIDVIAGAIFDLGSALVSGGEFTGGGETGVRVDSAQRLVYFPHRLIFREEARKRVRPQK